MKTSYKTFLIAVLTVNLVFSWISATAQPKADLAGQQLFQAINREREANGLPALKWDDALG